MSQVSKASGVDARQDGLSEQPLTRSVGEDGNRGAPTPHVHVAILGAGFAGLGMAIRLKQRGVSDFTVIEREATVGGTWAVNTYPGCACDVPSHLYSFSFAPNPDWTRAYSPQPEIQTYLRSCAQRYAIMPHIRFNTELLASIWSDTERRWLLRTSRGALTADILILGQGPLSEPRLPNIPGIETFAGAIFHSARWNHDYDLTGKRVAVIGTGASSIQVTPAIQPKVARLTLFQRTPAWIMPRNDHPIPAWRRALYQKIPATQRIVRDSIYWQNEARVLAFARFPAIVPVIEAVARAHLARQAQDPELRAKLTPHYRMGCKRVLLSDDFYPALTQPNVELVTDPIRAITPTGVVSDAGREYPVDAIILCTGFYVTDSELPDSVRGRGGRSLGDDWRSGPAAYLGTTVARYPNLFLILGPNTNTGHTSLIYMIEAQIAYALDAIEQMERRKIQSFEMRADQQDAYNIAIQRQMRGTVWTSGCANYYTAANGKITSLWPDFTFIFRRKTRRFDFEHYTLTRRDSASDDSALRIAPQ